MPENRYDRSQLFYSRAEIIQRRAILVLEVYWKFISVAKCGHFFGEKLPKDLLFKYFSTVVPVLGIAFHKRPAINITHIAFPVGSQKIESTNLLPKLLYYSVADELLIWSQDNRVPKLFALLISLNNAIKSGRFPCLGIHVVGTNGVYLNIESIGGQKFLIDVVIVFPDIVFLPLILARTVLHFSKQLLPASSHI